MQQKVGGRRKGGGGRETERQSVVGQAGAVGNGRPTSAKRASGADFEDGCRWSEFEVDVKERMLREGGDRDN